MYNTWRMLEGKKDLSMQSPVNNLHNSKWKSQKAHVTCQNGLLLCFDHVCKTVTYSICLLRNATLRELTHYELTILDTMLSY